MAWHPNEEDLSPWAKRALEEAYQDRARVRCSREDFLDGFLAALVYLRSRNSFERDAWQVDDSDHD